VSRDSWFVNSFFGRGENTPSMLGCGSAFGSPAANLTPLRFASTIVPACAFGTKKMDFLRFKKTEVIV